jgi:uncharacterized membrane protein YecN with MAPEG domain
MIQVPITLATTGILGLLFAFLSVNVSLKRQAVFKAKAGDRNAADTLHAAVRGHGNFAEYVPMALLLLGGIEYAGAAKFLVVILAAMLIIARVLHPFGLMRPAPNPQRYFGALLTYIMLAAASLIALALALK